MPKRKIPLTNKQIAIIGIVATIVGIFVPLWYQSHSDRPIISISVGENGPPNELHKEGSDYHIGISVENRMEISSCF